MSPSLRVAVFIWTMACSIGLGQDVVPELRKVTPHSATEISAVHWGMESLIAPSWSMRGAASCAASGCHGGPRAGVAAASVVRGSEYPLWLESDPHARSWRTLNSAESIAIMSRLGILNEGRVVDLDQYRNCLACHNTDRDVGRDALVPAIAEGVGCEACHGPSEQWYDRHYQGPSAVQQSIDRFGLVNSKPLLKRARMCAVCHVGASDRDMNHDIIAAGHPALYFDMAVYHESYPKHWRESQPRTDAFRAQLWAAGQIAKADAELELIAARAWGKNPHSTWPEFAQFQCTSCHRTLDGVSPVLTSPSSVVSLASTIATGRASPRLWNLQVGSIDGLPMQRLLQAIQAPQSEPESIAQLATNLRLELHRTAKETASDRVNAWSASDQRLIALEGLRSAVQSKDWEQAALAYIATWAGIDGTMPVEFASHMRTIRAGLVFPVNSQSPNFPLADSSPLEQSSTDVPNQEEWDDAMKQVIAILEKAANSEGKGR